MTVHPTDVPVTKPNPNPSTKHTIKKSSTKLTESLDNTNQDSSDKQPTEPALTPATDHRVDSHPEKKKVVSKVHVYIIFINMHHCVIQENSHTPILEDFFLYLS